MCAGYIVYCIKATDKLTPRIVSNSSSELKRTMKHAPLWFLFSATLLWSCSFEKNESETKNIKIVKKTDFYWSLKQVQPSSEPGPDYAYDGKTYITLKATYKRIYGAKAM